MGIDLTHAHEKFFAVRLETVLGEGELSLHLLREVLARRFDRSQFDAGSPHGSDYSHFDQLQIGQGSPLWTWG